MQVMYTIWATIDGMFNIDFDTRLQRRGTDFSVYANTGYQPHESDSALLKDILSSLVNDDSGVHSVTVTPYTLRVNHSKAVDADHIVARVASSCRRLNMTPTVKTDGTTEGLNETHRNPYGEQQPFPEKNPHPRKKRK